MKKLEFILRYCLSYLVTWLYKATFYYSKTDIYTWRADYLFDYPEIWRGGFPWSSKEETDININKTTYFKQSWTGGHLAFIVSPLVTSNNSNVCPWLLNLDEGMLQEIDVVEFINDKMYFSLYWNDKDNHYWETDEEGNKKVVYKRFQIQYKRKIRETAVYAVKWDERKVKWYINGRPVAVCYHYPIVQQMYLALTQLHKGEITPMDLSGPLY